MKVKGHWWSLLLCDGLPNSKVTKECVLWLGHGKEVWHSGPARVLSKSQVGTSDLSRELGKVRSNQACQETSGKPQSDCSSTRCYYYSSLGSEGLFSIQRAILKIKLSPFGKPNFTRQCIPRQFFTLYKCVPSHAFPWNNSIKAIWLCNSIKTIICLTFDISTWLVYRLTWGGRNLPQRYSSLLW